VKLISVDLATSTKSNVTITDKDYKAQGGEKKIYIKGGLAYGVYHNPDGVMDEAKARELAVVKRPNVLRPTHLLYSESGKRVGEACTAVPDAVVLCQLFTRTFCERNKVEQSHKIALLKEMQALIAEVHKSDIVIVDNNELNWLVSTDFKRIFAIDTPNWQTPSFDSGVIMPNIKDPFHHGKRFKPGHDWYSFAILATNLLVGKHPFLANHPDFENIPKATIQPDGTVHKNRMVAMMRNGVTLFDDRSTLPAACYPKTVVPPALLAWIRAVLEKDVLRTPPPTDYDAVQVVQVLQAIASSRRFDIKKELTFMDDVLRVYKPFLRAAYLTNTHIYVDNHEYPLPAGVNPSTVKVGFTANKDRPVLAWIEGGQVKMHCPQLGPVDVGMNASHLLEIDGRLIVINRTQVVELNLADLDDKIRPTVFVVGQALDVPHATQVYDGVLVQNMLGAWMVSLFSEKRKSFQHNLKNLVGERIIDARYENGVLVIVTLVPKTSEKKRYTYLEDSDYKLNLVRTEDQIDYYGMNWTVTSKGIFASIPMDGQVEAFRIRQSGGPLKVTTFDDPVITTDMHLFSEGEKIKFAKGKDLYHLSVKP